MCRRRGGEVDTDMHVNNDSAEGTHSAEERRDRSDHPAAAPDQSGDGRIRDGQTPSASSVRLPERYS